MEIVLTLSPAAADEAAVTQGLMAFNEAAGGPGGCRPVAVLLRDAEGQTCARGFCEKLGFGVFGTLEGHPRGGARYFRQKRFGPAPDVSSDN